MLIRMSFYNIFFVNRCLLMKKNENELKITKMKAIFNILYIETLSDVLLPFIKFVRLIKSLEICKKISNLDIECSKYGLLKAVRRRTKTN